mmetsp:Transcript_17002/g.46589  ORF Transcript_17002/g.46589 Transcript_17002/m.46589 type:complete len:89 (-) Transcript_17002:751-1017(-)
MDEEGLAAVTQGSIRASLPVSAAVTAIKDGLVMTAKLVEGLEETWSNLLPVAGRLRVLERSPLACLPLSMIESAQLCAGSAGTATLEE